MSWQKSKDEILVALKNQILALVASSNSFDAGNAWEAARIAAIVHILVHDSGRTKSLLTQLGVRGSARFVSSGSLHRPGNLLRHEQLIAFRLDASGGKYIPLLSSGPHQSRDVQFHTWWEKEHIFAYPKGNYLTRKRLVFSMRNQDGGAHSDTALTDAEYARLSRTEKDNWIISIGGGEERVTGAHLAAMRQIGWEIEQTIDRMEDLPS